MADIISLAEVMASRALAKPRADVKPAEKKSLILQRIQEVADIFGIDVEVPVRHKPVE
jgi:hypothetical protein